MYAKKCPRVISVPKIDYLPCLHRNDNRNKHPATKVCKLEKMIFEDAVVIK